MRNPLRGMALIALVAILLTIPACGSAQPQAAPTPVSVAATSAVPTQVPPSVEAATSAPTTATTPIPPTAGPQAAATSTPTTVPTVAPSDTPVPLTDTPSPSAAPAAGDTAQGASLWPTLRCVRCHGPSAQGGSGPRLAGTKLASDGVLERVRAGKGPMPAFSSSQISDQDVLDLYAWFVSLQP